MAPLQPNGYKRAGRAHPADHGERLVDGHLHAQLPRRGGRRDAGGGRAIPAREECARRSLVQQFFLAAGGGTSRPRGAQQRHSVTASQPPLARVANAFCPGHLTHTHTHTPLSFYAH